MMHFVQRWLRKLAGRPADGIDSPFADIDPDRQWLADFEENMSIRAFEKARRARGMP
jgi:hypothetical protein